MWSAVFVTVISIDLWATIEYDLLAGDRTIDIFARFCRLPVTNNGINAAAACPSATALRARLTSLVLSRIGS